ncbi:ATP-dependent DNA helicase PIF1 [Halyomorpha halys]|uniref:ATP-dependent DNA helicase PIF1 n=1 Tax=Halyomorpha halys TaxID=286706 RepID=UPI0006D4FF1B|nr:ATP-dependent DNA helicase PIF1-like [Halyomorpha halys]
MSAVISNTSNISCSCSIEWLSANGTINKTVKVKMCSLQIVRNEFRDLFMYVQSKEVNQKLLLKDVVIHKKFANEGKATIMFPASKINLLINNAPPALLISFLKILFIKLCSAKSSPKASVREKLLSTKDRYVQEISPINTKDVNRIKTVDNKSNLKRPNQSVDVDIEAKRHCLEANTVSITDEQKRVLHEVQKGCNVFFTGSAGTGKSYLLQAIINVLPPEMTVATASTGSAACLIGGVTLHSFAGIGDGESSLAKCLQLAKRPNVQQNWRNCKHLIIDEISMIDSELFEKIEWVARQIRGNDKPFGGIQVIVCGDFLQLPPVKNNKKRFCFMSESWDKCNFSTFILKQVHRQNDSQFISILNKVRLGDANPELTKILQDTATQNIEGGGILATRLCCYTKEAKEINDSKLKSLPGNSRVFEATDSPDGVTKTLDDCTAVEKQIFLKEGAQVMLLKNINVSSGLVNGARGVVQKFVNGTPVVKFLSGTCYNVKEEKWVIKTPQGMLLTRKQLPLRLAWAFSIHKSQGLTLDCVEICLNNTFEAGQAYVALSRAKSLDRLRVIGFHPKQVWANPDVLKFYKRISLYQNEFIPLGKKLSLPIQSKLTTSKGSIIQRNILSKSRK